MWISRFLLRLCFCELLSRGWWLLSRCQPFWIFSVSNWQYFCWQRQGLKGPSSLFWQRATTKTICCVSAAFKMLAVKMMDGERLKKLNPTAATKLLSSCLRCVPVFFRTDAVQCVKLVSTKIIRLQRTFENCPLFGPLQSHQIWYDCLSCALWITAPLKVAQPVSLCVYIRVCVCVVLSYRTCLLPARPSSAPTRKHSSALLATGAQGTWRKVGHLFDHTWHIFLILPRREHVEKKLPSKVPNEVKVRLKCLELTRGLTRTQRRKLQTLKWNRRPEFTAERKWRLIGFQHQNLLFCSFPESLWYHQDKA